MTTSDRIINTLGDLHERLAGLVVTLDDAALGGPSGAADWRIHDVLSHLGSGAEITLRTVRAAVDGTTPDGDNQSIWDRWNALSPRDQADGFLRHDGALIETLQGLTTEQRAALRFELPFAPEPAPLEVTAGMRLSEASLHTWDVLAGLEPATPLDGEAAELLLELYAGPLGCLLGFIAKTDVLVEPAVIDLAGYSLTVGESVSLDRSQPTNPTATFSGAPESAVRLLAGRLRPEFTPDVMAVTGNVTLEDLRQVFPGF